MARPRKFPPAVYHHPTRKVDRVRINGRDITLGPTGSIEAQQNYLRAIQAAATGKPAPAVAPFTVADLAAWWPGYCERTFRDGSSEPRHGETVLAILCEVHGDTPAGDLTPKKIRAVQTLMLSRWSRSHANRQTIRLKTVIRRACDEEIIPPGVYQRIACVRAVPRGTPGARETAPRTSVDRSELDKLLAEVSAPVGAMLELMWLTGMRPGEARLIRTMDIASDVYRPATHKCAWRGHDRAIPLGPKAMAILAPWLRPFERERHCFLTIRGNPWQTTAIAHEVRDGCERAGVKLTPYQLRHSFRRRAIAAGGIAAAMVAMGQHSSKSFDQYDKGGDFDAAAQLARKIG